MAPTRAERAASTRQKLLEAAVEQFLDRPYAEVSVHDLTNSAGVAYGLVAHYFGNKRGIYREAMLEMARGLGPSTPPPGPAAARIRHLVATHFTNIQRHPAGYLGLMLNADPESRDLYDAARQVAIQIIGQILDLDPERPAVRLAVRSWTSAVNEAAVVWLQDGCPFPVDDMIEMLMATLAEQLRQASRLDAGFEPAPALSALGRPD